MTASSINIAIAELLGWSRFGMFGPYGKVAIISLVECLHGTPPRDKDKDENDQSCEPVPNFHGDLNACAEMEAGIPRTLWGEWTTALRMIVQRDCNTEKHYVLGAERSQLIADFWLYHATAPLRLARTDRSCAWPEIADSIRFPGGMAQGMAQVGVGRAACKTPGCTSLSRNKGRNVAGGIIYGGYCHQCHHQGNSAGNHCRIDNSACERCGWDKAPCDRHRIDPRQGYKRSNVVILCPNCHRVETLAQKDAPSRTGTHSQPLHQ